MLSYGENPESHSLSPGLESVPGRDRQTDGQTNRQTDRITIAGTRLALRACRT